MWPRAFLDDPGGSAGADDDPTAAYGGGGRKRKGAAAVQVKFFELCRDGANARTEWRKRRSGEIADPNKPKRLSNGKMAGGAGSAWRRLRAQGDGTSCVARVTRTSMDSHTAGAERIQQG